MTIKKLLIANRGEIASRIMLSAHDMGISCVAIYTEADSSSLYVKESDLYVLIMTHPSHRSK